MGSIRDVNPGRLHQCVCSVNMMLLLDARRLSANSTRGILTNSFSWKITNTQTYFTLTIVCPSNILSRRNCGKFIFHHQAYKL